MKRKKLQRICSIGRRYQTIDFIRSWKALGVGLETDFNKDDLLTRPGSLSLPADRSLFSLTVHCYHFKLWSLEGVI